MPNVSNLINKSRIKKLWNKQHSEPFKCMFISKTDYPLKGKCQYKCIVYEVEEYGYRPNNRNNVKG